MDIIKNYFCNDADIKEFYWYENSNARYFANIMRVRKRRSLIPFRRSDTPFTNMVNFNSSMDK